MFSNRFIPSYEDTRRYWQSFNAMPPAWIVAYGDPASPTVCERLFFMAEW